MVPARPTPAFGRAQTCAQQEGSIILGAVVFAAMLIGLVLYNTRNGDEPINQHGLISAPATPAGTAGMK